MPSFFSRQINFTTGKEKPINFTTTSTGAHSTNIRRIINKRVITEFLELQRGWLSRAYSVFKDLDKLSKI